LPPLGVLALLTRKKGGEPKFWQQIEPRSRTNDFSQSVQAKIHDPLWMLTRQWQLGEFQAESAGSPIKTRIKYNTTKLTRVKLGKNSSVKTLWKNFDTPIPLEPLVEQERSTPISQNKLKMNWREKVKVGQQFEDEIKAVSNDVDIANTLIQEFRKHEDFKIFHPNEYEYGELENETIQFLEFMANRSIDGSKLIDYVKAYSEDAIITPYFITDTENGDIIKNALRNLKKWIQKFYVYDNQDDESAWQPERLEYEFSVSAPLDNSDQKQKVLVSTEYTGGNLDWYNFSEHPDNNYKLEVEGEVIEPQVFSDGHVEEMIPTNLVFQGMPNHRWWEFEDRQTDFGSLDVRTTDLGKLLVMNFALVSGNDWFIIPLTLDVGTLAEVTELEVEDVFGDTTPIKRAGSYNDEGWQGWDMFNISTHQSTTKNTKTGYLFLPPTLGKIEESPPLEEVKFIRDQMANIVFSIESLIANGIGNTHSGFEEYRDKMNRVLENNEEVEEETSDIIKYKLSTVIPDNWIPWLPVHQNNQNRAIQFRIAEMVRSFKSQLQNPIEPKSHILQSLGNNARINEEAISRASVKIQIFNKRARWIDGTTHVFLGKRIRPGSGEGSSGLRYDFIDDDKDSSI